MTATEISEKSCSFIVYSFSVHFLSYFCLKRVETTQQFLKLPRNRNYFCRSQEPRRLVLCFMHFITLEILFWPVKGLGKSLMTFLTRCVHQLQGNFMCSVNSHRISRFKAVGQSSLLLGMRGRFFKLMRCEASKGLSSSQPFTERRNCFRALQEFIEA